MLWAAEVLGEIMKKLAVVLLLSLLLSPPFTRSVGAQGEAPELKFPESNAPAQAQIDFYENEIKKCKDYVDELSLAINKAEILIRHDLEKSHGALFAGYMWSKEIVEFRGQTRLICNRIEIYQRQIAEISPPPSPTPTPSPNASPTTETKSGGSGESTKTKQDKESYDKQVKLVKEYRQELRVIRIGASRITIAMDDYVKKNKITPTLLNFKAESTSGGGLSTTTFTTPQGRLLVHLPTDSRAGDTLSGTVVAEPKGETELEQNRNLQILARYQLRIANQKISAPWGVFAWNWPLPQTQSPAPKVNSESVPPLIELLAPPVLAVNPETAPVVAANPETAPVVSANPDLAPVIAASPELAPVVGAPDTPRADVMTEVATQPPTTSASTAFQLPTIGQNGRASVIRGPFDGNLRTTEIRVGGQPVTVFAESPRNCIFQSPEQNLGPAEITVKENNVETKGTYRNLGVRLSAPKTNLLKGESTTVTITVEGLKGIQRNVPLLLEKKGDVSMEGGDVQTIQIRPNDVVIEGTQSRADVRKVVVGLRPGFFNITATVVNPTLRPIIIPLIENGGVNGYRVKKDGTGFVINVENVKHPVTGDPVDGEHKLEHQCPTLSKVPYLGTLFLDKGIGKTDGRCLVIIITPRIIIQNEN